MKEYGTISRTMKDDIFEEYPAIDAKACTRKANEYFKPYLFYHWASGKKEIELWSSCCNRHEMLPNPPRTVTPTEMMILYGKHNDQAVCPWCGREVTLKETGRLGKRKNLREFQAFMILKADRGNLYARAYWARKDYQGELHELPKFRLCGAYCFRNGSAEEIAYSTWSNKWEKVSLEGNYDPVHRVITEMFVDGWYWWKYESYFVIGIDEIGKSDLRYCQYEKFWNGGEDSRHTDMINYFSAASVYPKQIEMLMKSGFEELVKELIYHRRKNSRTFNWNETDYLKAFGLSKQELREFREAEADWRLISEYKMLRNRKLTTEFRDLKEFQESFGYETHEVLQSCRKWKVKPMRLGRYLSKFCGGCPGGVRDIRAAWQHWKDYVTMAQELGWDLKEETVLLPADLYGRHDEAAEEKALKDEREMSEQLKAEREAARALLEKRKKKYDFAMDDYFIQIAGCAEDVRREGKALQHCVGGYAERHMKGKTTILFLRKKKTPDVSLYTIEMDGDRLVQIHGFRNERDGAPDPKEIMAWMLDPWMRWLKKGSPRNKDGSPKLPKKKERIAA